MKMIVLLGLVASLGLAACGSGPEARGEPRASPGAPLRWSADLEEDAPVLARAGDRILVLGHASVSALDVATGKPVWRLDRSGRAAIRPLVLGAAGTGAPTLILADRDERVDLGREPGEPAAGSLRAVDGADGRVLWSVPVAYTPLGVSGPHVLVRIETGPFVDGEGGFAALDTATGKSAWRVLGLIPVDSAVAGDVLAVTRLDRFPVKDGEGHACRLIVEGLDVATGRTRYGLTLAKVDLGELPLGAGESAAGEDAYLAGGGGSFLAYHDPTRTLVVFVAAPRPTAVALDAATGTERWRVDWEPDALPRNPLEPADRRPEAHVAPAARAFVFVLRHERTTEEPMDNRVDIVRVADGKVARTLLYRREESEYGHHFGMGLEAEVAGADLLAAFPDTVERVALAGDGPGFKAEGDDEWLAPPLQAGDTIVAFGKGSGRGELRGLDRATGAERWTYKAPRAGTYEVRTNTGHGAMWFPGTRTERDEGYPARPVLRGRTLHVAVTSNLVALDVTSGKPLWTFEVGHGGEAAALADGGEGLVLYAYGRRLYAFAAE